MIPRYPLLWSWHPVNQQKITTAEKYRKEQADVLSVRFPKECDHINLAAKHPKLCTYFIQYAVYLWFFHTSIHPYMHACMHEHLLIVHFSKDMYIYNRKIHIHTCVCVVRYFDVFWMHIQEADVLREGYFFWHFFWHFFFGPGSWWLRWLLVAPGGFCGSWWLLRLLWLLWLLWLLAPRAPRSYGSFIIYRLSINLSVKHVHQVHIVH